MNQNVNIDLIPKFGMCHGIYFSQYDVGRDLTINVMNGSTAYEIPSGATVKLQATKPSGLGFSVDCTYSNNVVTVVSTETMTNEYGRFPCELVITSGDTVLGSANFLFNVEKSPHPAGTVDGDSGDIINQITIALNNALADIEDAKEEAIEEISEGGGGITDAVKTALLNCFAHVAWVDENGQTYYDALEDALYPPANLVSISAVYTQSGTVYDTDSLDSLKSDLVVTAYFDDSSTRTIPSTEYTLSGTLTEGTSTITVLYGGKTTTFDVTVTAWTLTWDYTDGGLPTAVASSEWTLNETGISTHTISFDTDNGIKWVGRNGGYTLTPINYQTTSVGTMEIVVRFESPVNPNLNIRATLNTASDTLIGFIFKDGIKVNGSGSEYSFISGTEISLDHDYTFRVERNANSGKVYLDGVEVYSGELRTLSGTNNVMISTSTTTSSVMGVVYIKAIRFKHIS